MILRITQYGEKILQTAGRTVVRFDKALTRLAEDMVETMHHAEGIGLAAQQVNSDLLIFVMDLGFMEQDELSYELDGKVPPIDLIMPMVCVNPKVNLLPSKNVLHEEGCLSFPGIRGDVERPDALEMTYQDLQGGVHLLRASGWFARVIQHEYDHLQGTLFIDRMTARSRKSTDTAVKRLKKATTEARPEAT